MTMPNVPPPAKGMTAKDAIGKNTCSTCPFWHNPLALPHGVCIYNPPTPVFCGLMPAPTPAIVDPKQPQIAGAMPVVLPYFPTRAPEDGCGRHPGRYH